LRADIQSELVIAELASYRWNPYAAVAAVLASRLAPGRDFVVQRAKRAATLTSHIRHSPLEAP